jgi:hypothetical protein
MAQQRGTFVFGWVCAFVVMVAARAAFDAPMFVTGVLGLVGYYVVAPGVLVIGLKCSEFFIKRRPGGAALLEEHKAEQEAARKTWNDINNREAAGERIDPVEKSRVEGILFRNEGVVRRRTSPVARAWESILAAGPAAGVSPELAPVITEVLMPMGVNPVCFFDNLAYLSVNGADFLLGSPLSAEPERKPHPTPSIAARPHKAEWPLGHPLWFIAAFPDVSEWASETQAAAEFKGDAKAIAQMQLYYSKVEKLLEGEGVRESDGEEAFKTVMLDTAGKTSPKHGRVLVESYLEATRRRLETATP